MANSRFGYVRSYEQPDHLLPNTYVVVRIDGKGFTKLTARYGFVKPNDLRGLSLMNAAAEAVMKELPDVVLAYGQSDEYSFVFPKDCQLFERRASKLTTLIVSVFTANYVFGWSTYFPDTPLTPPLPSFDGRAVCYPSEVNVRDYLSWRQVDCHINNLFNTTFWALVQQGGMDRRAAEQELSGTVSADKNEILFSRFGINYNNEPEIFKKGTVLYRDLSPASTSPQPSTTPAKTVQSPPPTLSHPQPKKLLPRPMSQPLHSTYPSLFQDSLPPMASDPTTPRGPTFLSTSTTPSPPPTAREMSIPTVSASSPENDKVPLAYPQTFFPVSPPSNSTGSGSTMKSPLPSLTPLPLPPPTLKPSTRPPPSLSPPNPTAHTNFSPLPSPNVDGYSAYGTISPQHNSSPKRSKNAVSHSASASLSRPPTTTPATRSQPKRSPSMSILNFSPPQIPIRISSIPLDAPTRKLSLPSQKSYAMQRAEEKENTSPGRRDKSRTPPLRTMKELPSPPVETDYGMRSAVMGSEPQEWSTSPARPPFGSDRNVLQDMTINPLPSEPPPRSTKRTSSHSRLNSAPPSSTSFFATTMAAADAILSPPLTSRDINPDWSRTPATHSTNISPTATPPVNSQYQTPRSEPTPQPQAPKGPQPPKKDRTRCSHNSDHHHIHHPQQRSSNSSKKVGGRIKDSMEEDGGWLSASAGGGDGRPLEKSKTQREKERKKKMKAKIVTEHVDIIKDGFWEKRPWILSGRVD